LTTSCSEKKTPKSDEQRTKKQDSLVAFLDTIWNMEQIPLRLRDSIGTIYGFESKEFRTQQELVHKQHNINEKKITHLLDSYGWPAADRIGEQGNLTICNVLQHADLEIRLKYLPMMREATKEKKLSPRLLARAEDRIATDRGDLQIYGGQIKYYPETKSFNVWPIADPANVDKRRAALGLEPMREFLANLRQPLPWDVEEQVQRSNEFIENRKRPMTNTN